MILSDARLEIILHENQYRYMHSQGVWFIYEYCLNKTPKLRLI